MELTYLSRESGTTVAVVPRKIDNRYVAQAGSSPPWTGTSPSVAPGQAVPVVPGDPGAPPPSGSGVTLETPSCTPPPNMQKGDTFECPSPSPGGKAAPVAAPGQKAPSPSGNGQHYGGPGQQSGTLDSAKDYIIEDGEVRGMHENFGKKTGPNLGVPKPPIGIPDGNYSLADAIGTGGVMLTEIAAGLAVGFLIWGALKFATAAGDEENTAHAKQIMKWSIGGLIIALIAFGMVSVVSNAVGST